MSLSSMINRFFVRENEKQQNIARNWDFAFYSNIGDITRKLLLSLEEKDSEHSYER